MSTQNRVTRRELARLAVTGVSAALLTTHTASAAPPTTAMPDPTPKPPNEGDLLIQAVPINVGYALTETQTKNVKSQLDGYPGTFAKARAYIIPDDVGPAFATLPPAPKKRETK